MKVACTLPVDEESIPTNRDGLDRLACRLKPLFRQREHYCHCGDWSLAARRQAVGAVEATLRENGLAFFVKEVTQICQAYLRQKNYWRFASRPLDPDDFVMEVLIRLTTYRLQEFDPERGHFTSWLRASVLRSTYTELKRRQDPYWGRPALGTRAQHSQFQARALAESTSLDLLVGESKAPLHEVIPSEASSPERLLLEEQCACRFREALGLLTTEEQVLVERAFLYDETHETIARSLGVSRVAVTRRLGRICDRLMDHLGTTFCEECSGTDFGRELFTGGWYE